MDRPLYEQVFLRDEFRCVYCGFDGSGFDGWVFLSVDHFKPRHAGGTDDMENLMTACVSCNQMKGGFYWPSLEEAKAAIEIWRTQMRTHWEKTIKPLVAPTALKE